MPSPCYVLWDSGGRCSLLLWGGRRHEAQAMQLLTDLRLHLSTGGGGGNRAWQAGIGSGEEGGGGVEMAQGSACAGRA